VRCRLFCSFSFFFPFFFFFFLSPPSPRRLGLSPPFAASGCWGLFFPRHLLCLGLGLDLAFCTPAFLAPVRHRTPDGGFQQAAVLVLVSLILPTRLDQWGFFFYLPARLAFPLSGRSALYDWLKSAGPLICCLSFFHRSPSVDSFLGRAPKKIRRAFPRSGFFFCIQLPGTTTLGKTDWFFSRFWIVSCFCVLSGLLRTPTAAPQPFYLLLCRF